MKTLFLSLSLLLSVQVFSQVRTGTGPDREGRDNAAADNDLILIKGLGNASVNCGPKKSKSYRDLIDFYVKHTTIEGIVKFNTPKMEIDCSDAEKIVNEEVKCLFRSENNISKLAKVLENKTKFMSYYEDLHNLSPVQSLTVYNYYEKIYKELGPKAKNHAKKGK